MGDWDIWCMCRLVYVSIFPLRSGDSYDHAKRIIECRSPVKFLRRAATPGIAKQHTRNFSAGVSHCAPPPIGSKLTGC